MADKHPISFVPGCNTSPEVIREQFKQNIDRPIRPFKSYTLVKKEPIAIVCGGPSLKDRIEEIRGFEGPVLSCNGAYNFLLENNIPSDYFMLLDCREENISFIEKMGLLTIHYIAAQAHPSIFDRLQSLGAVIRMYLTNLPDLKELIGDRARKNYCVLGGTVGTVGIKAMALAHALGYRKMHLFGYDSSYADDEHHAFPQPLNDNTKTMEVFVEDRKYITSPTLANQAEQFPPWAKSLVTHAGCEIELHCSGLLPDFMNHCNKIGQEKSLEEREREKYEEIWQHDSYRKHSPGENLVDYAFEKMGMQNIDSIVDFGCGTGRALEKFRDKYAMPVHGIDHAGNCLDESVDISFHQCCLWEGVPWRYECTWGYCTDVMEHIPTDKVMAVIKNISDNVKKGCFFNIATRDDAMGSLIGKKLHLTIASADAWKAMLKQHFREVVLDKETEGEAIFLCFK